VPAYPGPVSGNWNGVGDVVEYSGTMCVVATRDRGGDPPGEGRIRRYSVTANVIGNPNFELTETTTSATIPFSLAYQYRNRAPLAMPVPGTPYGNFRGRRISNCNRQSRFEVFVAEADMLGMLPGTYQATLNITHTNLTTGETASGTLDIVLVINVDWIQLNFLDDVDLGSWDGIAANLTANESFNVCGTAPQYQITATGGSGAFTITDGTDIIAYEVLFAEGTDASSGLSLTHGVAQGVFTVQPACVGDNAAIYVRTLTPLESVGAGSYGDQLTITVAPI